MSQRERAAYRATIGLAAFLAIAGHGGAAERTPDDLDLAQTTGTVTTIAPDAGRVSLVTGLGPSTTFLHDGRAKTLEEAIRLHDGEAARARAKSEALTANEREALLSFLRSL